MVRQFDLSQFSLIQLARQGEEYEVAVNMSRRLFVVSGLLLLSGCASSGPRTTAECMQLSRGGAQMECLSAKMFPEIVRGAVIGAVAGAVLGGAVAFAVGGNPLAGLAIGGIAGGVAGGLIAYYNFTLKRADGDPVRALSDVYQDSNSDLKKFQRFADASTLAFQETAPLFQRGVKLSDEQRKQVDGQQIIRAGFIENGRQTAEVLQGTSKKLDNDISTGSTGTSNQLQKSIDLTLQKMLLILDDVKGAFTSVNKLMHEV